MRFDEMTTHLEELAGKLSIRVRWEPMEGAGGLCQLKGKKVFIGSSVQSAEQKAEALAKALADFKLDDIYVLPEVRQFVERMRDA
ncbi:MAG: hypothetical protein FJ279_00870 [Planctomycetes bacterium]|nr:hypothetical protein [Planctomycetota bacterium]